MERSGTNIEPSDASRLSPDALVELLRAEVQKQLQAIREPTQRALSGNPDDVVTQIKLMLPRLTLLLANVAPGHATRASLEFDDRKTAEETTPPPEKKTRDDQEALRPQLALQEEARARASAVEEQHRSPQADGPPSRRDVEEPGQAVTSARQRLKETQDQLASAERIAVEAQGLSHLAALPPTLPGKEQSTPEVLEYRGITPWTVTQVATLDEFFEARFKRPLPVSALGQTHLHDLLRFDHRNAVDVSVHPDSVEGRALIRYLRAHGIPFLAFRGRVPGAATGAHIHVGAPSPRQG